MPAVEVDIADVPDMNGGVGTTKDVNIRGMGSPHCYFRSRKVA